METFKSILIWCAIAIGLVWPAVFICALSDKLRGYQAVDFTEGDKYEPPPGKPMAWWQHVLLSPLYALFLLLMVVLVILFVPPLVVLGCASKLKALLFRRVFRRGQA